ncbi:MAG TPA: TIR domain-containing protein [Ktedonobacterales bacterium]
MAADPNSSTASSFASSGSWSVTDLVFLSYSRADREQVEAIASALRARGASVWYDTASAAGGTFYVESVQRALRRTSLMLVFVSANSVNSSWVTDELRAYRSLMVREPGHQLLAVHLDRTRTPISLAGVPAIDARGVAPSDAAGLIGAASGLASLTTQQPAPATETAQPEAVAASTGGSTPPVTTPMPVASGSVYLSYDAADSGRVQPVAEALRGQGVAVAESGANGLRQAQTLLVAISAASAESPTVSEDLASFHALASGDASRAIIAMHLDQTVSPHNLNGANAVDAQSLSPSDTARLIVAALPAGATVAAIESVPATAIAEGATMVAPPAVDVTDAALVEPAPALDATETASAAAAEAAPVEAALAEAAPDEAPVAETLEVQPASVEASLADTAPAEAAPAEAAPAEPAPADAAPAEVEPVQAPVEESLAETTLAGAALVGGAVGAVAAIAAGGGGQAPAPAEPTAPAEAAAPAEPSAAPDEGLAVTTPAMAAIPLAEPAPASQPQEVVARLRAAQMEATNAAVPSAPEKPASNRGSVVAVIIIVIALIALTLGLWFSAGMPL